MLFSSSDPCPHPSHAMKICSPNEFGRTDIQNSTHHTISVQGVGDIQLPIPAANSSLADNARVHFFLNELEAVYEYYSILLEEQPTLNDNVCMTYPEPQECATYHGNLRSDYNIQQVDTIFNARNQPPPHTTTRRTKSLHTQAELIWSVLVMRAVTSLETNALGNTQSGKDVAVVHKTSHAKIAAVLIRQREQGMLFQVCLLFGERIGDGGEAFMDRFSGLHSKWQYPHRLKVEMGTPLPVHVCCSNETMNASMKMQWTVMYWTDWNLCHFRYVVSAPWKILLLMICGLAFRYLKKRMTKWVFGKCFGENISLPNTRRQVWFSATADWKQQRKNLANARGVFCVPENREQEWIAHEMELSKYLASNSTLNGRYDVNNATDDENYRDTVLENPIDSEPVPMQRGNSAIVYSYKLPRKVFACAAEDASLLHILKCAVSVRSGETSELVTCVDDTVVCGSCQINIKSLNSTSQQSRTVQLHTLLHGIITITVVEFVCGSCG